MVSKAAGRPTGAATDEEEAEGEEEAPGFAAFTPAPRAMLLPVSS